MIRFFTIYEKLNQLSIFFDPVLTASQQPCERTPFIFYGIKYDDTEF